MILIVMLLVFGVLTYLLLRNVDRLSTSDSYSRDSAPRFFAQRPQPPAPRMPTVLDEMESATCEVCSSSPRIQFYNFKTSSRLEFCRHHGNKNEAALLEKGYEIKLDGRDL